VSTVQKQEIHPVVSDSKIKVPDPPPGVIARRHAESLLPRFGEKQPDMLATLLCAPNGYGKTTVVSNWARDARRVAWLNLDEYDNDLAMLCAGMLAAMVRAIPTTPGISVQPPQRVGADTIVAHLVDIVDIVDRQPEPVWLVLDGLDRLRCEALQIPELLVQRASRRLRLILCTRQYPATGLHRLRTAGRLREIRAADLTFTAEETVELLAGHGLHLAAEELSRLMATTEGRPVAVRLAAEALADTTDHTATVDGLVATSRAITDRRSNLQST
jgi:LuxR family transcriptional regulator, maltose regulon positive regulatory protein